MSIEYNNEYIRIEELARKVAMSSFSPPCPEIGHSLRQAFTNHLLTVSRAARELQRADEGDTDGSGAVTAICTCLQDVREKIEFREIIREAERVRGELCNSLVEAYALQKQEREAEK